MSRKRFSPFVLLEGDPWEDPDDPTIPVHNTGSGVVSPAPAAGGEDVVLGPMSFNVWSGAYGADYDENGSIDMGDYIQWWTANGFDMDAWNLLNGDLPFGAAAAAEDVIPGE